MQYIDLGKDVLTYALQVVNDSLDKGYKNKFATTQNPAKAADLRYRGFLGEIAAALFFNAPMPSNCYGRKGQDFGIDLIHKGQRLDIKTTLVWSANSSVQYCLPIRSVKNIATQTDFYIFVKLQNISADLVRAYLIGSANFISVQIGFTGQRINKGQPLTSGRNAFKAFEDCILIQPKDITPLPNPINNSAQPNNKNK